MSSGGGETPQRAANPATLETVAEFSSLDDTVRPQSVPVVVRPEPPVDELAAVGVIPVGSAPTPIARRLRKRRRRRRSLVVPLVFLGLALAAAGGWWWYANRPPKLEGGLSAVMLSADEAVLPPKAFDAASADVPAPDIEAVQKRLAGQPETVVSGLMEVDFRAAAGGLEIGLRPGVESAVFRVDPAQHPPLREFVGARAEALDAARRDELETAAREFFQQLAADETPLSQRSDALRLRDQFAINSLIGALGYHTAARIGNTLYPCAYEDAEGRLCFLLPFDTTSFELVGRFDALGRSDEKTATLVCRYMVTVEREAWAEEPEPPAEKPGAE